MISSPIHFPRVDDVGVGDGGVVIGAVVAEQVSIRIEMQDAGFGEAARGRDAILDRRDGATRSPDVVDDEGWATAHFFVGGELDELGPRHDGFFFGELRGEVYRRSEDVRDVHRFGEHARRDDAAARNDHHRGEFAFELRDEMVNETIHFIP